MARGGGVQSHCGLVLGPKDELLILTWAQLTPETLSTAMVYTTYIYIYMYICNDVMLVSVFVRCFIAVCVCVCVFYLFIYL